MAQDYANPLVRPHLHFYPEIPDGPVTEVWEAEKWRKHVDPRMLTPMVAVGSKHFYVFEFARLVTGEYVVPERWIKYKSEMHGEVFQVTFDCNGIASIDDSTTRLVKVSDFRDTFLDLSEHGAVPQCDGGQSGSAWRSFELTVTQRRQQQNMQMRCPIPIGSLLMVNRYTPASLTTSEMMFQETSRNHGTNIGIYIFHTETSRAGYFSRSSTFTSSPHHPSHLFPNSIQH